MLEKLELPKTLRRHLDCSPCACGAQRRAKEVAIVAEPEIRVVSEGSDDPMRIFVIAPTKCQRCDHQQRFGCEVRISKEMFDLLS